MALFNRQKNSDVPAELQPYYDAPRSGPRGWLRWLVRIVALLIVVAALVIGGRWGWQKIVKNDTKVGTTVSQQGHSTPAKPKSSQNTKPKSDTSASSGSSTSSAATDQSSASSSSASSSTGQATTPSNSSSTPPPTTPSPASSSSSTPSTAQSSPSSSTTTSTLTNTGPGDTVTLLGLAVLSGTALYQSYLRLKKRSSA